MGPVTDGPAPGVWKLTFLPSRSLKELISGRTSTCNSEMYISEMKFTRFSMLGIFSTVRKCSNTSACVMRYRCP